MLRKSFIFSLILTVFLFSFPFILPVRDEEVYLTRLYWLDRCFKDGQIPCRWVPDLENFYGSPVFHYHPPLPFYFAEVMFLATQSLTISIKIILTVSLVGSYFLMYLLIRKFLDKFKACLWAFFYSMLAALAVIFYQDGLGLAGGLMFIPLVLLSLNMLLQKRKIQIFIFSYTSLSLLILSSNLAFILIGLGMLWILYQYIKLKSLTYLLIGLSVLILAFLLSSFYILPAILERNLIYSTSLNDPLRFLPKAAVEKPTIKTDSPYQILAGESSITNFEQGTNWLKFQADTETHTIIRLSQFYFPNFKIFIDGKETQVEYKNNSLGLMTIIVGEGEHIIEGRLFDTPIRIIANIITVVTIVFTVFLGIIQFQAVRNSLNYYKKRVK